jgi:hypothetical protein
MLSRLTYAREESPPSHGFVGFAPPTPVYDSSLDGFKQSLIKLNVLLFSLVAIT